MGILTSVAAQLPSAEALTARRTVRPLILSSSQRHESQWLARSSCRVWLLQVWEGVTAAPVVWQIISTCPVVLCLNDVIESLYIAYIFRVSKSQ